jgi:hypothetical protein
VGSIAFIGTEATDFSQSNTCGGAGGTVAAGKTCTFTITFSPKASEIANAQMTITAANGSVFAVQLLGTGNIPIYLTPRNMSFDTYQLVGTKSAGKTDTFTNKSGVDIYFTLIDLEGANENEFSFTSTCAGGGPPFNYSVPLLPGASCTSTIYFSPVQSGGANDTQVYYGNMTLMKQGLLIQAEGTAVKVTPTSLTFPSTTVGATSAPMTVTFQNAGSVPLPISSATFMGSFPYWNLSSNTCGSSVPANSTCTYGITFTPQAAGTFTATFSIGDQDPTGPQQISLTGTGN